MNFLKQNISIIFILIISAYVIKLISWLIYRNYTKMITILFLNKNKELRKILLIFLKLIEVLFFV